MDPKDTPQEENQDSNSSEPGPMSNAAVAAGIDTEIPEFPEDASEDAQQKWLNDRVNSVLAHAEAVSSAGIPMGLLAFVVTPKPASTIVIPGQAAPDPSKRELVISVESPAISVAQFMYQQITEGAIIDDTGIQAALNALLETKIALERSHAAVEHLIVKMKPKNADESPAAEPATAAPGA